MITKSVLRYKRWHRSRQRGSLLNQNTILALVCGKFFSLMCRISAEKCCGRQSFRTLETSFFCSPVSFLSTQPEFNKESAGRVHVDECG